MFIMIQLKYSANSSHQMSCENESERAWGKLGTEAHLESLSETFGSVCVLITTIFVDNGDGDL